MCACVCACVCICIHVCACAYMYMCVCMCVFLHCMCVHMTPRRLFVQVSSCEDTGVCTDMIPNLRNPCMFMYVSHRNECGIIPSAR